VVGGGTIALLLFFAHFFNDLFSGTLAALLPTLQIRFGVSELTLALFVACLSFSSSVLQPLFGAAADRFGHRLVAAAGVIVSSAILSLIAIMPSPLWLVPLLLLGGLGSAAYHPAATTLARRAATSKGGLALAVFSAGGTTGLAFGPLVIGFFLIRGWLQYSPVLMVPGIVLGVLIYALTPPQPRQTGVHRAKIFDLDLFRGPVGQLCLAGVLRSIAWVSVINGAPLWLVNAKGLSATSPTVFWTITVFTISGAAGGILIGLVESRFSRQFLVTGTMLLAMVPLAVLLLSQPGSATYFVAVALAGMLANGGLPIMVLAAQDAAPHAVATASGMMMGLTWGTAGLLYLVVGAVQEAIGMTAAMWLSVVPLLPGALVAYRVLRRLQAAGQR
jgi:FSR family fosmidomycin resistance protein-like MFS transporter